MAGSTRYTRPESRWKAVIARDRAATGAFFYAVRTTGVFCRPGCASRLPNRENVEFFTTSEEAVRAGYRPCKRCTPGADATGNGGSEKIIQACRRIEAAEAPLTLEQLAAGTGWSPGHFHRLFKKQVGITPRQYAARRQAKRYREGLHTRSTVTEAIHGAGFGSTSRAYEKAGDRLAMKPSAFRKGAAGLEIRCGTGRSYLGRVIVAATDRGICAIEFGDDADALLDRLRDTFPKACLRDGGAGFQETVRRVVAGIEAPVDGIDLPLDIQGTAFQERVWKALRDIPPGQTKSYGEIAREMGRPGASRAVAGACAANRLAVAIPCHRAVRRDGQPGGYRWGAKRKRALLRREGCAAEKPSCKE